MSPERRQRSRWIALALALVVVAIVTIFASMAVVGSGPASPTRADAHASRAADANVAAMSEPRRAAARAGAPGSAETHTDPAARAQRDRTRARILDALARAEPPRGSAATARDSDDPEQGEEQPRRAGSGGLKDRIGGRDALLAALDDDFMPLADECLQAAHERDPSLRGMLAISLEVIADEEIGAVVETVDFPETNEVHDALLHECIRETSLSTILPPPPEGGREGFMLTIPVEPSTPDE